MISRFYLASIHPECAGSVGNALRQCLGTRVQVKRVDPRSAVSFDQSADTVACLLDVDGIGKQEARRVLETARTAGLTPVIISSDASKIPSDLVDEFMVWTCISSLPEGKFRTAIQSVALDLINVHMLNRVETEMRSGYNRTTRG